MQGWQWCLSAAFLDLVLIAVEASPTPFPTDDWQLDRERWGWGGLGWCRGVGGMDAARNGVTGGTSCDGCDRALVSVSTRAVPGKFAESHRTLAAVGRSART